MRKAILDGLVPEFSNTPFALNTTTNFAGNKINNAMMMNQNKMNMMMNQQQRNINSMVQQQQNQGMLARGGQLVVAGSVVGQWGANYGGQNRGMSAGGGGARGGRGPRWNGK